MSFVRKIRDRGVILSAEILFNRFVPAWLFRFSVGDLFELDLPQMRDSWNALKSDDFDVSSVTDPQERSELRKFTWNSVPLETTENDFGYAVSKSGENDPVIGGVWAARESFIESDLGFKIEFQDNQAWLYCAYVDANTRGLGVYKRVLSFVGHDLTERGFYRLLVIIQPWNKASMHIHQKFAQKKLGRVAVLRLGRMSFVFCTGAISKNGTLTTKPFSDPILLRIE